MHERHEAREAALQMLYFCDVARVAPSEAADAFVAEHWPESGEAARAFARELTQGAVNERAELDEIIARHAQHWRIERLALIDRLILRLATWELRHHAEVPAAVVIDEAIELARTFSTDGSAAFVNGVLDAIRKELESSAHEG
jgi:N utilization substance protein B